MKSEEHWKELLYKNARNYKNNVDIFKDILIINRGYITEIPYKETVILLFSGGMDSTILIDIVIRLWKCKIILLYFKRNSKNQKWEEKAVDFFYHFYQDKYPKNILELIKLEIEIPHRVNKKHMDRNRQKYFGLPLRNAIMWNNAFTQAIYLSEKYNTSIRSVLIGSVKEDETSVESGILSILAHNISICSGLGLWYYQLLAPLLNDSLPLIYNKTDLLIYSNIHNIPIEKTRSCFESTEEPCNKCLACENRNNAYFKLNDFHKYF